jgi:hypothetical protein
METITLQYDSSNMIIKKLIEVIISLGGKVNAEKEVSGIADTMKASEEADKGDLIYYKDMDDFKKRMYAL